MSGPNNRNIEFMLDTAHDIAGSFLYAVGTLCFIAPSNIAPGGASGIAIILNYLFSLPIGITTFIINIPLMLLALRFLGKRFTIKTLRSIIINTIVFDFVVSPILNHFGEEAILGDVYGDRLLGSLFGGVLIGSGLVIIFLRNSTTGGTDIAGRLLRLRFPHIQMGRAMMLFDAVVILVSMFVFQSIESGLYALITIFVCTRVIDSILYGVDRGCMALVISSKNRTIATKLMEELDRGVTFLHGEGAYSGSEIEILVSAVRRSEFHRLKSIVYKADPSAFIIVTEVGEILGEGFKDIRRQ